ncbi:MAG TPA: CRISPR-associated helicase Cas3' [Clostridiales bacterium]|nr:CRISPR-associated helicase Cas3' [Clostridiales bacterium]
MLIAIGREKTVNVLCSSEFFSHPNKLLADHLTNVANMGLAELLSKPVEELSKYSIEELAVLIEFCGFCHDMGKSTKYFQKYLFASQREKIHLKSMPETHHGLLSAIITYYCVHQYFNDEFLAYISFLIVKRHHGNFRNVVDESKISEKEMEVLNTQVESIDASLFDKMIDTLHSRGFKGSVSAGILHNWIASFPDDMRKCRRYLRRLGKKQDIMPYMLLNFLFSILIDADKCDAVFSRPIERIYVDMDESIVDAYKSTFSLNDSKINILRERAYREIVNTNIDLDEKIYSINLPTGLGKTLSSLAFALKLRKRVIEEKDYIPRIIYSLPFLSIIEQNGKEYEKVLMAGDIPTNTKVLLKHHHLTDIFYDDDESEFDTNEAKFLIEGWNSEIIITTFIQFFHTLMSNKNSTLRKFHKISGSIILLDEIQSLPTKYWEIMEEILRILAYKFQCYIVFITATDPYIIGKDECISLTDSQKYFTDENLNRVILRPILDKGMRLEEFMDTIDFEDDKSYLFVLNTISCAKDFYKLLKERLLKEQICGEDEIAFLSTHVVPKERLSRIEDMKDKKYRFAVTTQLIEAGVDIDYDVVYRDFAPLDSINQTAGRCNREGKSKGEVYIVSLCDENRRYASYIYDSVLLDITKNILINKKSIAERAFLDLIDEYYRQVKERKSYDESRKLLDAVYNMKYTSIDGSPCIADFRLIDNDVFKIDVFIELDDYAKKLWTMYMELKDIKNPIERKVQFDSFKADFYQYVISVPATVKNFPVLNEGFGYISSLSKSDYYDIDTGYICEDMVAIW